MNLESIGRLTIAVSLWLALLACTGCASFSKGDLPRRDLADFEKEGKLTAVTYQFAEGDAFSNLNAMQQTSTPSSAVQSVLQLRVEPIFRRVFIESTRRMEPGEWHLDMYYRETARNPAVTYSLALFFIISLGIVPAYAQDDLYLEVKLKHNGETVRQYIYNERVTLCLHWFMLPWSYSNDPMETKASIIDNMVLNLLYDLKNDLPRTAPAH